MVKQDKIGDVPGNIFGMLSDLAIKLQHGGITPKQLELFVQKKNPFEIDVQAQIKGWQDLYEEILGLEIDFSCMKIPDHKKGFDRLIIVFEGLTIQRGFDKYQESFPCWKSTDDDLDKVVTQNDRSPKKGPYAIWVRDTVEADEIHKNKSAHQLQREGIQGITLLEALLFHLKYFKETGKHLNIKNITMCSGSRSSDGDVPDVYWDVDELRVRCYHPDDAFGDLRSREVVS